MSLRLSSRSVRAFLTTFVLLLSSCSTADRIGPNEPVGVQEPGGPKVLFDGGIVVDDDTRQVFVACAPQPKIKAHETIGPEGGVLELGRHRLVVPEGALDSAVTITGVVLSDSLISVRLTPKGLTFAVPARLTLSYAHCDAPSTFVAKHIVYTSEALDPLEILQSADDSLEDEVSADLDHFSRYAVAW